MYSFKNDYSEGAHPRILNALVETNLEQAEGYGKDRYSMQAIELLKERMGTGMMSIFTFYQVGHKRILPQFRLFLDLMKQQ